MAWKKVLELLGKPKFFLLLLSLVYLPFLYYGVNTIQPDSDEYTYHYMAYMTSKGYRPYADFFCAHMPLMVYPLAFLYKIFGPNIAVGKFVESLSFFSCVFLTYLIGERYRKHAGILASALLFFSPMAQPYARSVYGVFPCLALGLMAFYFHQINKKFLSGFFIVMSIFVRLNIYPLLLLLFLLNRREKQFYLGLLAASPMFLFFLTPNFLDNTVLYHLEKTEYGFEFKNYALQSFRTLEWFLMSLFIISAIVLLADSKQRAGIKKMFSVRDESKHYEMRLIFFILFFFMLTLTSRVLFDFYFLFIIPFMALIVSFGMVKIAENLKVNYAFFAIGLLACSLYFNHSLIESAYKSTRISTYEELIGYVSENTAVSDRLIYIGMGNTYVALNSNRMLEGYFIDTTDEVFFKYKDTADQMFLDYVAGNRGLVVVDLRDVTYLYGRGVNLTKTLDYLRENYVPVEVFYDWTSKENRRPFVVWRPKETIQESRILEKPFGMEKYYLLERYFFYLSEGESLQELIDFKERNVSEPYIPESMRGGNTYQLTLIPENVLRWPLKEGYHYQVNSGLYVNDVWISSIKEDNVKVMVEASLDGETVAWSEIYYNNSNGVVERITSFSRMSETAVKGFIPTYQQIPLTEEEYSNFQEMKKQIDSGLITGEEFNEGRIGGTSGMEHTQYLNSRIIKLPGRNISGNLRLEK